MCSLRNSVEFAYSVHRVTIKLQQLNDELFIVDVVDFKCEITIS